MIFGIWIIYGPKIQGGESGVQSCFFCGHSGSHQVCMHPEAAFWQCVHHSLQPSESMLVIFDNTNNPPRGDRSAGFELKFNIFNWILINSVLKLLLYGPRIGIIHSDPGNIGN